MYIVRAMPWSSLPRATRIESKHVAEAAAKLQLNNKYSIRSVQLWTTGPTKSTLIKELRNG